MNKKADIKPISDYFENNRVNLPEETGVYAFWWIGDKTELLHSNRIIKLKGPSEKPVIVEYRDWWPKELKYPCLYVGKSTNIKQRFSLHIKRGSNGRLHEIEKNNHKVKPVTTSCQLRHGIEHIFRNEKNPLELIFSSLGFSYRTDFKDNPVAERFFEEDRLIGNWRPWFNIDSER